jgi:lysophospholipase L1-like esterase
MTNRPRLLAPILVALGGTLLVLVLGEAVVRTWIQSPSAALPDARFGWRYVPGATIVYSSEGHSVRRTNSLGLLDDEPRVPRPRVRALLVGDSYAEALSVPRGRSFAEVVERLDPDVDVVNAGISGSDLLDRADWLDLHAGALRPDVIVVQLTDGNLDVLLDAAHRARMAHPPVPGVQEPAEVESGAQRLVRVVMRRSALATASLRRLDLLVADQRARLSRRFREAGPRAAAGDPRAVGTDPRLPAVLDSLHVRIARHAPRVVYVYIPHLQYFTRGAPRTYPGVAALLHDFAARESVALIDGAGPFRAEFARTGQPVHGFSNSVMGTGHLNAAGHRVLGEALARELAEPGR